jgi:DNA primase
MSGMIPQSFIDNLLDRVDIVEVVDYRVKLKKTGKNYSACCPFHIEKTPSFTVSPEKQFFYCFGCGASGNALSFIMDFERLSYPEAIEQLARTLGMEVPREVQTEAQIKREEEKKSIYSLLEKSNDFFQAQLRQHPSKHMAVNYLKGRGLDGKTAKEYGVGFAPPGWDNLLKSLATSDEEKHLLIEGGMLIHQAEEKKLYDRFRHRIMFPIRDTRGRVIGFGGRVLGDDKPKYLNSPETPVFHKGQELYGLYEARMAYRELPRLLVVEGYMDVVSLAQFGIRYGVATLGTACGEDHLERAFKYTTEVVFCFDGDRAGRAAAHRALEASLTNMADGRTIKFLFLPEGEDPDTLVRQIGPEKFERMIDLAVPLEDFLFDAVSEGLNVRTMEGRATFSKRAAPLLEKLPKSVFRELMFENLAKRTGLSRSVLQDLVAEPVPFHEVSQVALHAREPNPKTPKSGGQSSVGRDQEPSSRITPHIKPDRAINGGPEPVEPENSDLGDHYDHEVPPADYDEYYSGHRTVASANNAVLAAPLSRYIMPPVQKAIALLLMHPEVATLAQDPDVWLQSNDIYLQMLGRLVKVLRERPHYNLSHLVGYWRGAYGSEDTERLAKIAGSDLLHAATALTFSREDKPAKADYDFHAAFVGCLEALNRQQSAQKSAESVERLRSCDFSELSKEERNQLVSAALSRKVPSSAD